ncbi:MULTISPECIES: hypothetical protein [unclassified Acinetobacter]|uniref:hypothetical protein n=1 Tax=unclassified Acinetobacter TaxID=196816 RepID=UPI001D0E6B48|nr:MULTISPECIES: hypothetical protein [unclassified Acinetobacter]
MIEDPLKEAWTLSIALLSALTTIGAAIIAAYLFNDWKIQHNKSVEVQIALKMIDKFDIFDEELTAFYAPISFAYDLKDYNLLENAINNFKQHKNKKVMDLHISFLGVMEIITKFSLLINNKENIEKELNIIRSTYRKFSIACLNINDTDINSCASKLMFEFSNLIPIINDIENKYIILAVKKLKA